MTKFLALLALCFAVGFSMPMAIAHMMPDNDTQTSIQPAHHDVAGSTDLAMAGGGTAAEPECKASAPDCNRGDGRTGGWVTSGGGIPGDWVTADLISTMLEPDPVPADGGGGGGGYLMDRQRQHS